MFKPKIREMKGFLLFILKDNISGITLAPFGIFLDKKYLNDINTINHEKIHWQQQLEILIIFFYLWYIIEWFIKLFKHGSDTYYTISFEREAYENDNDLNYCETRKHFAWLKRILR